MLSINNLTLITRQTILEDFSFHFEKGTLYGIVATNGSGKTTLFRAITQLIPIQKGTIELVGENKSKREFFYFETSEWFDTNLSGMDYLTFVKKEWKSTAKIEEIIHLWEMEEYIHLPIKKYSLGMKQRVLIAMYLVSQANYLLMDEITNGLDEASRGILFQALTTLKQQGKMVLLSSHYKEDIEEYCDYLLTIQNKKMEVAQL
ncbi:ABC-type multidrug transport system, ATPase component [Pilibacter termitis]|jgi:ABC-2 type transport system ATP-binding protein|uniref:ABC-type multidrug transport system, ATPase component n=1 Tax=Pilibacter termitis TaxID=263852 RepID=A0A1T4QPU8_9ENTE|nr:ABC transporter ATP-binding protein [Pilibacter termitis]SKA05783.1 ABC-type multidrug transport system, ATPase component [Pilibacter termitis]